MMNLTDIDDKLINKANQVIYNNTRDYVQYSVHSQVGFDQSKMYQKDQTLSKTIMDFFFMQ